MDIEHNELNEAYGYALSTLCGVLDDLELSGADEELLCSLRTMVGELSLKLTNISGGTDSDHDARQ